MMFGISASMLVCCSVSALAFRKPTVPVRLQPVFKVNLLLPPASVMASPSETPSPQRPAVIAPLLVMARPEL
jgi:hypothetical protein